MSEISLDVHSHDGAEAKLIKIDSDATVEQLVQAVQAAGAVIGELEEEFSLLVENEEKLVKKVHKLSEHGIKHGHHVYFHKHHHGHRIEYFVDDEPQHTTDCVLTPVEIMNRNKPPIDPKIHYVVRLEEHGEKSYKDKPDERIHMHPCMRFITGSLGPTPVS